MREKRRLVHLCRLLTGWLILRFFLIKDGMDDGGSFTAIEDDKSWCYELHVLKAILSVQSMLVTAFRIF